MILRLPDPAIPTDARLGALWDALGAGDRASFEAEVARLDHEARALGSPRARWCAAIAHASRAHLVGRLADAEAWAERALSIGRSAPLAPALHGYALQMLSIRREQGRLAELEPLPASGSGAMPRTSPCTLVWQIAWHWTQLTAGRTAATRELLRHLTADGRAGALSGDALGQSLLMLADIAVLLREPACAEAVHRALEPLRDRHGVGGLGSCHAGSVARARGTLDDLLERFDDAERHFEAGLAADRRLGALPFVARGLVEYGAMLSRRARRGDPARARQLLDDGGALARELGMSHVAAAARRSAGRLRKPEGAPLRSFVSKASANPPRAGSAPRAD